MPNHLERAHRVDRSIDAHIPVISLDLCVCVWCGMLARSFASQSNSTETNPGIIVLKWGLCTKWQTKRLYYYKFAPSQPTQMKRNESDRNTLTTSRMLLSLCVLFVVRDSADEHVLSLRNSTVFYFVNCDTAPHIAEHEHRLFSNLDWYISGRVGAYGCLCCATICFQKKIVAATEVWHSKRNWQLHAWPFERRPVICVWFYFCPNTISKWKWIRYLPEVIHSNARALKLLSSLWK